MQSSPSVESKIKKALSLRQITEEKRAEELAQIQYGSTAQNTVMSSNRFCKDELVICSLDT